MYLQYEWTWLEVVRKCFVVTALVGVLRRAERGLPRLEGARGPQKQRVEDAR